jgi:ferritin-like metal-binding protein YciE
MADDLSARDAKLVQYLNEAYGKEKQLETALQADAKMAGGRASYRKRLQDHLKETKAQARALERRIKQLGGKAEAANLPGPDVVSGAAGKAATAASKAAAAAKAPVHALRGTGEAEKLLKNAKTQLMNEHEEIGNYLAIETLAEALRDRDTAKLAREFRRQEERMAAFLSKLIPTLTKAVVTEEVPASQRRAASSNGATRSRSAKPAKSRAKRPAKSRAKARPAKRAASRSAKPAKTRAKARPAKTRAKARPAKSRAKARPAKRAASSS